MTILITAKDVGRVAVDADWCEWRILAFLTNEPGRPVVASFNGETVRFSVDGYSAISGSAKLIRFADAPEQQPPETVTMTVANDGEISLFFLNDQGQVVMYLPSLAGQTFTYELRRK